MQLPIDEHPMNTRQLFCNVSIRVIAALDVIRGLWSQVIIEFAKDDCKRSFDADRKITTVASCDTYCR